MHLCIMTQILVSFEASQLLNTTRESVWSLTLYEAKRLPI
jgi:hypothetical protein